MRIQATPGELKRLRRTAGSFQRTFRTPLDRLPKFVAALLPAHFLIASASLTLDEVVFTPKHLEALLSAHQLQLAYGSDWTISATGRQESTALLEATLADWVDFYFRPEPKRFLLYADHHEYTTIFAVRKGMVSRVADALKAAGFAEVPDFVRAL